MSAVEIDEHQARAALEAFEPIWDALLPEERERLVHLLIERVDYDGQKGEITLRFHPTGIVTLAAEVRGETANVPARETSAANVGEVA